MLRACNLAEPVEVQQARPPARQHGRRIFQRFAEPDRHLEEVLRVKERLEDRPA